MKKRTLLSIFFALGFFSLLSQTLIIREFLVSFGGNELGIGLFYALWLFWVGTGAFITLTFLKRFLERHFFSILSLYPLLAFLEIVLFIVLKGAGGVSWWEFFSLEKVLGLLFAFTSFISLFTGIIFTLCNAQLQKVSQDREPSSVIYRAYVSEGLGSFLAGVIVTILIAKLLPPFLILAGASLLFGLFTLWASISFKKKRAIWANAALVAASLIALLVSSELIRFGRALRMRQSFPHGQLLEEVYTPYQHLLIANLDSQKIIISNGEVTSNIPDEVVGQQESALFVSMGKMPKKILIFGYGAENVIRYLLDFPVENITYVIEDEIYYKTVYQHLPLEFKQHLRQKRLHIIFTSPRLFLKDNSQKFDFVLVYTPDPSNLVINTFFTKEFYHSIKTHLRDDGVIATRITAAPNYIGEELRNYGSALLYTLQSVFPQVIIIPGKTTWFFAGGHLSGLTRDALVLERRFRRLKPPQFTFPPEGFRSLLMKRRMDFIEEVYRDNPLFKHRTLINSDTKPLTYFLNLLVLARYSNSYLAKIFKGAFVAGSIIFIAPLIILLLLRLHFLIRIENIKNNRLLFNSKLFQFFSGLLGFSFHLTLIFLFQNKFGTLFQLIGLVNAVFMLGLCTGGIAGKLLVRKKATVPAVMGIVAAQGIIIIASWPVFVWLHLGLHPSFFIFIAFFLVSGVVTGCSYPLAASLLKEGRSPFARIAAHLELLDHWGGATAGLLAGLFLLPLLGVAKTIILLGITAGVLITILALELLPGKLFTKERAAKRLSFPYIRTFCVTIGISLFFIITFNILNAKRSLWEEGGVALKTKDLSSSCQWQEEPFRCFVCEEEGEPHYIVASKDFASHIRGFAGPIHLSLTVDKRGRIKEVKLLQHRETSSYVEDTTSFLEQFKGHSLQETFSLETVDAISGATITSQAIIEIINTTAENIKGYFTGDSIASRRKKTLSLKGTLTISILFASALILYIFLPRAQLLRKIYLIFVVVLLGFRLNLQFSMVHLANLITFNLPSLMFPALLLLYLLPLISGLFLGQFYCGWLCPFGALQEIIGNLGWRRKVSKMVDKRGRFFKYIFLAIFVIIVSVKRDASLFRQEPLSVFFSNSQGLSLEKLLAVLVLLSSVFFLRFWCRYFCVCGAFLALFNKIAILRRRFIKQYPNCTLGVEGLHDIDCIQCNLCRKK